jgi:ABC-type uncharacterized transport system substrate-binding protein
LVGLQPDIIVTNGTPTTVAVQQETRTIPIVFASAGDPIASGLVARLERPSGIVEALKADPRTVFMDIVARRGGRKRR